MPILFVLPVANLRWTPGLSFHADGFRAQREFDAALRAAAALREAGKLEPALAELDRAIALSPEHAMAHFQRGALLAALGRDDEARAEWREAIDRDGVTHRLTAPLTEVFLDVMEREHASWVDLRPRLQSDLSDTGARHVFVDHVHPTAAGHQEMAAEMQSTALALLRSRATERGAP